MWQLSLWFVAAATLLLLTANGNGLSYVHRRALLSTGPLGATELAGQAVQATFSGRIGGQLKRLPTVNSTAFQQAFQRCRAPDGVAPPLPTLKRAGTWEGSNSSRGGNTTVVTTLHIDRLELLEAHCAVWPHTIVAAVYAPISSAARLVCLDEVTGQQQVQTGGSWLSWLGLAGGPCPHAGWSLDRLRRRIRQVQKRAQAQGQCNLKVDLWTEQVPDTAGDAVGLLPQAALQNKLLLAMQPQEAAEHHAVVLLDSDMVSVDIWQLVNWPARWERAEREMQQGRVLVLPAFQLVQQAGHSATAMQTAMSILTAEAGKFPLRDLYEAGQAQPYQDHGFRSSQEAALPELWFEAGDMHGSDDDGYPVVPTAGFAPFVMMLQRHVPWADERLRGSYYQRAWQAVVARANGMQHTVQPNTFALQLPHAEAHSMGEAELSNFMAVEPVLKQLVKEVAAGEYVPVTSFGSECTLGSSSSES